MNGFLAIRYTGHDLPVTRRFLIERQDGQFWAGRRWTGRLDEARLYRCLRDAQVVSLKLQRRRLRGRAVRHFHCDLTFAVVGDAPVDLNALREYLIAALHLNIDVAAHGDGPGQSVVIARANLGTLAIVEGDGTEA